jgi:GntR family transcriptional regulator of gluconate operon
VTRRRRDRHIDRRSGTGGARVEQESPEGRAARTPEDGGEGLLRPLGPRRSLVDEVAERIREVVLVGVLPSGTRLSDSGLAREIGVGRSSVREAFKVLLSEGFLEQTGRGVCVARLTVDDVHDTYELRLAVECRAVRILAARHDEADIAPLRGIVAEFLKAAAADDVAAAVRLDLRFHESVCLLSGSTRLHEVFTREVVKMLALLRLDDDIYQPLSEWIDELPTILDAIRRGDADGASAAMEAHIESSRQLTLAYAQPPRAVPAEGRNKPGKDGTSRA